MIVTIVALGFLYLLAVGICLGLVGATRAKCEQGSAIRFVGDGPDSLRGMLLTVEHCQRGEAVPIWVEDARDVA